MATAKILYGSGDVSSAGPFEPTISTITIHVIDCAGDYDSNDALALALAKGELLVRTVTDDEGNTTNEFLQGSPGTMLTSGGLAISSTGTGFDGPQLIREVAVSQHPNEASSYLMVIRMTGMGWVTSGNDQYGDPGVMVTVSAKNRRTQVFRTATAQLVFPTEEPVNQGDGFYTFPPDEYGINCEAQDIQGYPVDRFTKPTTTAIPQSSIQVEYIARAPYWDDSVREFVQGADDDYYGAALSIGQKFAGKRNATELWGYPIGSLLLNSVDISPLHYEYKRVVMSFTYDEWFHLEQVPSIGSDGVAIPSVQDYVGPCEGSEDDDTFLPPLKQAAYVGWFQPFLEGFEFTADQMPANVYDGVTKYLAAVELGGE